MSFMTSRRPDTFQVWNFIDTVPPKTTQATPGHFRDHDFITLGVRTHTLACCWAFIWVRQFDLKASAEIGWCGQAGKTFHQNSGAWNAEKYWSLDMQPCEQHCLTHTFLPFDTARTQPCLLTLDVDVT